jgi:hypothetical protein
VIWTMAGSGGEGVWRRRANAALRRRLQRDNTPTDISTGDRLLVGRSAA